ncbi:MAG: hypothetical protein ACREBG_29350 [Pyrinomonadaceae bacterium]
MIDKLKPALLGGLITGILSVIPIVSSCCCLWAIGGGLLACFLYIRSSTSRVSTGEGAVLGIMSGAIGALIYLVIGLPIALIFGMGQMEEAFRRSGVEVPLSGIALVLLSVFLVIVIILVCSTLGGLLGVPLFEKRKGSVSTPPPPQDLSGGPSGT